MNRLELIKQLKVLYNAIQFNWGIKRFFSSIVKRCLRHWVNYLILPVNKCIEKRVFKVIVKHYGADYRWADEKSQNIDTAHLNYGYGSVHYSIIRSQRLKRVLCVGSMYGFVPYMMAKACMENGEGVVDFVDAGFDMNKSTDSKNHNYGLGFWKKINIDNHFSRLLDNKYINVYMMTSENFADNYNYKYDYICLDADHRYREAKKDFKRFWPRLNEEGFLVFHDIHLKTTMGGIKFGYWKLWQELIKKHAFKFELPNAYSSLGFLQKMNKPRQLSTRTSGS